MAPRSGTASGTANGPPQWPHPRVVCGTDGIPGPPLSGGPGSVRARTYRVAVCPLLRAAYGARGWPSPRVGYEAVCRCAVLVLSAIPPDGGDTVGGPSGRGSPSVCRGDPPVCWRPPGPGS